jgi:hypothetical protein
MISVVDYFAYILIIYMASQKWLLRSLLSKQFTNPFLLGLFVFFSYWVVFFMYSAYQSLVKCIVCKYFIPFCIIYWLCWLFLWLCRWHLVWCSPTCLFLCCSLWILDHFKHHCKGQYRESISLCFLLLFLYKNIIFLLTFRWSIQFWVDVCSWWAIGFQLHTSYKHLFF